MQRSADPMALVVEGLNKSYGALVVARDVGFRVPAGSALGVIGPNGAGKTTLFNLITGTTRADSGRISLFGQEISTLDTRRRCVAGIARSFQVPQPFGGLTVFENALIAAAFGRSLSERAARPHAVSYTHLTLPTSDLV